jgi:formylglycine-generating enzyme required for sulfatase activity
MQRFALTFMAVVFALVTAPQARAQTPKKCPIESVKVGTVCVDIYEASAWEIPPTQTGLIKKVQKGKADLADLTAGGATQLGCTGPEFGHTAYPATFPANGNWTTPVYAASVAGALPSACITWFQAEQACALSGKRLLTNQEWQRAAAGTPDPGGSPGAQDCNTNNLGPVVDRSNCRSRWGVANMVGNVEEWVADWVPRSTDCPGWGSFSDDFMCLSGASTTATGPGAPIRGGDWVNGPVAGVFAVDGFLHPYDATFHIGFRCAR